MADKEAEKLAKELNAKSSETVKVVVRIRPLSSKEKQVFIMFLILNIKHERRGGSLLYRL
jgi:hypothetical protein